MVDDIAFPVRTVLADEHPVSDDDRCVRLGDEFEKFELLVPDGVAYRLLLRVVATGKTLWQII